MISLPEAVGFATCGAEARMQVRLAFRTSCGAKQLRTHGKPIETPDNGGCGPTGKCGDLGAKNGAIRLDERDESVFAADWPIFSAQRVECAREGRV
jgi:hypothetical protein